jgi:hypothetical protein
MKNREQAPSLSNLGYDVLEAAKKIKEKREQAPVLSKVGDGVIKTTKNNEKGGA